MLILPQNDVEDVAGFLRTDTLAIVQRSSLLLPVKETPVHRLVDALTGSSNGRGADGRRSFDGLGVDAHGRVFTTHGIVPSGGLGLGVTVPFCVLLQLFLGSLQRTQIVVRLDEAAVAGVCGWIDIVSMGEGDVGMQQHDHNHKWQESDAT